MKKKNLLAMAVLLSVLQGSSCFAYMPTELIMEDKVYDSFVESYDKAIALDAEYNNKDAVYTFKEGAYISLEDIKLGDYLETYTPIYNDTSHNLTVNVGGALAENGQRYEFYLKAKEYRVWNSFYKGNGIVVTGEGSDNNINLNNANMIVDLGEAISANSYPGSKSYGIVIGNIGDKNSLNIVANESNIDILSDNEYGSIAAIYVTDDSELNINASGKSDINIIGNFGRGIETSQVQNSREQTAVNIQGINDLNIKLDTKSSLETYGILAHNEKFNINAEGNIYIGSTSPDKDIVCGLLIESERFDVDFDIAAKGNFVIDNAAVGIYARPSNFISGGDIGKTDINITANSVYINANRKDSIKKTGLGIFIQGSSGQGRAFDNIINSKGEDGINIDAEGTGILVENWLESKVHSKFIAENGGINISSGSTGIYLFSGDGASDCINTKIEADKDINIYAKNDGIESVIRNGSLNINSNEGNINIVAERDALKSGHVWYGKDLYDEPDNGSIALATGKILTNITAEKNVFLSGKETGIKYATVNSAEADIKSNSGNVFVLGEKNGIYLDSQSIDKSANNIFYEGVGNLGKHDIDIKAENGSVYIGSFGENGSMSAGGNGVLNNGKSKLNVEAGELVVIQGDKTALTTQKQGDNVVKGKEIILNSNGIGLKAEGANDVVIGYEKDYDNKKTESISIIGNVGAEIKASNLGIDDVKNPLNGKRYGYSDLIYREDAKTEIAAQNINIFGNECGLKISQAATAEGSDENAEICKVWRNNNINIEASGQLNIVANNGNAINVDGINHVDIVNEGSEGNEGNTLISGKNIGINLTATSSLAQNIAADGYEYKDKIEKDIAAYKDKTALDNIRENNKHVSDEQWTTTKGEEFSKGCENLANEFGCGSFKEFYGKLFTDEAFREEFAKNLGWKPDDILKMDPNGDPVEQWALLQRPDMTLEELREFLAKTNGELIIEYDLEQNNCSNLKEYFRLLVKKGLTVPIVDSIYDYDLGNEFSLFTKGKSLVIGSSKAINVDGGVESRIDAITNYIVATNYREDDELDNLDKASTAISVSNGGELDVDGYPNIIRAGRVDEEGFGSETAVSVTSGGILGIFTEIVDDDELGYEVVGKNILSGSVFADGEGSKLAIYAHSHAHNFIYSSAHGRSENLEENGNDMHVVNAVFATNKAYVEIGAFNNDVDESLGVNHIYSKADLDGYNAEEREITVWAENGATVRIGGTVDIVASNSHNYLNGDGGNALGIAIAAGNRTIKHNSDALNQEDKVSTVMLQYDSMAKDSFVTGDIVAGYRGLVDIGRYETETNVLHVNGNILSENGGKSVVDFGNGGSWIGRADDYFAADKKNAVGFFESAFSDEVKESGTVDVAMDNGMWSVTGQSWLTSFTGGNNTIDMVNFTPEKNNSSRTNAVAIQSMNGENNKFIMSLDNVNRDDSDMLYIKDGNATINVEVNGTINGLESVSQENGLRFATVGEGIKLDKIAYQEDGKAFVRGKNGGFFNAKLFVERQDYAKDNQYNTEFNGGEELNAEKPGNAGVEDLFGQDIDKADNLVIVKVEREDMSDAGSTVLDLSKVNYSNAVYMDRFNKRMGEARFIDGDEGIWVRMRHDRIGKDDAFRSSNTMYEIGYDAKQLKEDGEHRVGFAMDYMDGSSSFSKVSGSGEVNRKGLWMYDSWIGEKGHYRDLVAKWGHLSNDFEFMSGAGEATGEFGNNVYSVSAEFGKKNDIGNNWYFEPQAQLQYAHVTGSDYVTTMDGADQTQIRNDAFNSLIARAGFRIGKDVDARSTVYLKADVMHEFLGEQDVFANDGTTSGEWAKASYDHGGTWYDLGFGYSTKLNEASYVYIDVETSFGNDYEKTYQINGGVQWSF